MFYVKTRKPYQDKAALTPITADNVVCLCENCGAEIAVDLMDFHNDDDFDLYETEMLCEKCAEKWLEKRDNPVVDEDAPLPRDVMQLLAVALRNAGHGMDVIEMCHEYDVNFVEQIPDHDWCALSDQLTGLAKRVLFSDYEPEHKRPRKAGFRAKG